MVFDHMVRGDFSDTGPDADNVAAPLRMDEERRTRAAGRRHLVVIIDVGVSCVTRPVFASGQDGIVGDRVQIVAIAERPQDPAQIIALAF